MEKITEGRTITETDIVMFSYFTGDWTSLHTDVESAKKSMFGERIAHGYLTLSVSLGLMIRGGVINADLFMAMRSINHVIFLRPVKIGDTLRVIFSKKENTDKPGKIEVITDAKTINQRKEIVMEFQTSHIERSGN
ncbi:MAG: MaoC/PaaZ C-terminal domain-containing protein [Thermoplasmataceae archaeon]